MKLVSLGSNYRTYATVVIGLVLAALQTFDPSLLDRISPVLDSPIVGFGLSLLGVGFLRLGVAKQTQVARDALVAFQALSLVYKDVASQVTVPSPDDSLPSPPKTPGQEKAETASLNKEARNGVK